MDTPTLFATINARSTRNWRGSASGANRWVEGTHSESTIDWFSGAGGEHTHALTFRYAADHPAVLVGADRGPTPVEFLLHALASCITAGIGNIAAARGVTLHQRDTRRSKATLNLQGILGLSEEVRNGYEKIRASFVIQGDAPAAKLREIARAGTRSLRGLRRADQRRGNRADG